MIAIVGAKSINNRTRENVVKLGWMDRGKWDPRKDIKSVEGKIVEIVGAKLSPPKGEVRVTKAVLQVYGTIVQCPGYRASATKGVGSIIEMLENYLHVIANKSRLPAWLTITPQHQSCSLD
mmetsp:Transcript_20610/g.31511  ORF Transcript_20610/g.31511 Transcript_20610/m.31511 type:complete len:121 (+) Transcript_20610:380-742(+)